MPPPVEAAKISALVNLWRGSRKQYHASAWQAVLVDTQALLPAKWWHRDMHSLFVWNWQVDKVSSH